VKLSAAIDQYVQRRRAVGFKITTTARTLTLFVEATGADANFTDLTPHLVRKFIAGGGGRTGPYQRQEALEGFLRFARARGFIRRELMPPTRLRLDRTFEPHIYTHAQVKQLLAAAETCQAKPGCTIEAIVLRTFIATLYATGLRLGEALRLNQEHVDLKAGVIRVIASKFYKTRLVPIGPDLSRLLQQLAKPHRNTGSPLSPFFTDRYGKRIVEETIRGAFHRMCDVAGVARFKADPRFGARMHDLRHTFAVHRLIDWYRRGIDVQRRLPALSTYMGHRDLRSTQHYLTMTPELLRLACDRFERYARRVSFTQGERR
jgi:integrase/recombinase XerD